MKANMDTLTLQKLGYITEDMIDNKDAFEKYFAADGSVCVIFLMDDRERKVLEFVRVNADDINELFATSKAINEMNYIVASITYPLGIKDGLVLHDEITRIKISLDSVLWDRDTFNNCIDQGYDAFLLKE